MFHYLLIHQLEFTSVIFVTIYSCTFSLSVHKFTLPSFQTIHSFTVFFIFFIIHLSLTCYFYCLFIYPFSFSIHSFTFSFIHPQLLFSIPYILTFPLFQATRHERFMQKRVVCLWCYSYSYWPIWVVNKHTNTHTHAHTHTYLHTHTHLHTHKLAVWNEASIHADIHKHTHKQTTTLKNAKIVCGKPYIYLW